MSLDSAIDAAVRPYVDKSLVPGVVTLVARAGRIEHFGAIGFRDVEAGAAMGTDAIFRIASMTKPITSVALMMLREEGHVDLSDPVSEYLPEFSQMQVAVSAGGSETEYSLVKAERPIEVQHLLTHTAGLANFYRGPTRDEYRKVSERQHADERVADFVERIAGLPLNFQPGEAWEYSRATCVVGRVVEVIADQTLDEFFRSRIFAPLGMVDTHFRLPESKVDRFTACYSPGRSNKIQLSEAPTVESRFIREPYVYFMGSGGLVSTALDYHRFQQMMLNRGELDGTRLLSPETVELMTTNHTGDLPLWLTGPGYGFGLGYSVVTDPEKTEQPLSPGTYSWGGVYSTHSWVDPVREIIGILMTQVRPNDHLTIRRKFVAAVQDATTG